MPARRFLFHRATAVACLTRSREEGGYPRLRMFLLVSITGGGGFLGSFRLLHAGLVAMWLRTSTEDYADAGDPCNLIPSPSNATSSIGRSEMPPVFSGESGTADGRTLWPFVLTAVLFSAAGWCIQHDDPGVRSIGDVMRRKA